MALSLLNVNTCNFPNCGLNFSHMYDLIAHIEFVHIPLHLEDYKRQAAATSGEDRPSQVTVNLPLSCFQRVFPQAYRAIPTQPQVVKVSFNHYRKRPPPQPPQMNPALMTPVSSVGTGGSYAAVSKKEEDASIDGEDTEECGPNDLETRYRCNWIDCGKRFKNGNALKTHLRVAHNSGTSSRLDESPSIHQNALASALEAAPNSTKYAQSRPHKCAQCSKRYKTPQGLQNHLSQAHQKLNGSSTPDANAPSPAALAQMIIQKTQGQQQGQAVTPDRQSYSQQRPLSVSLAPPQTGPSMGQDRSPAPQQGLPVRSFHLQSARIGTQPYPVQTTGQMLKQQMRQQPAPNAVHQQMQPVHYQSGSHPQQHPQQHTQQVQIQSGMESHHPIHQPTHMQHVSIPPEMDMRNRYANQGLPHQSHNGDIPPQDDRHLQ